MNKILIQLGKKEKLEELRKEVTVVKQKTYFIKDPSRSYHTEHGEMTAKELQAGVPFTKKGKDYVVLDADFMDRYRNLPRGAQIIPLKDIGTVIAYTGINDSSVVVDAGAGSGAQAILLANIAKHVYTYEIRDDFFEVVRKNIDFMGMKNITLKKGNVYEKIDERDVDVITFDLPEPWLALDEARKALKVGGYLVVYNPSVPQISDFIDSLTEDFLVQRVIEVIEREWEFKKRKVRPKSRGLGHSGFLCFVRKIR